MKLSPALNFINIKRTNFSYKCCVLAAFSSYMYVEKQRSYKKFVSKMLMKFHHLFFFELLEVPSLKDGSSQRLFDRDELRLRHVVFAVNLLRMKITWGSYHSIPKIKIQTPRGVNVKRSVNVNVPKITFEKNFRLLC